jgi:rRNA-processing protein FCF1
MLLIDAANVVGSRPTGWWRDRAGAARQLVDRVRSAAANSELPQSVIVVLEGVARQGVEEGLVDGVEVVHAPGGGDDTLAALAEAGGESVILVSADRALGERIRRVGGQVVGPNWLFARLGPEP